MRAFQPCHRNLVGWRRGCRARTRTLVASGGFGPTCVDVRPVSRRVLERGFGCHVVLRNLRVLRIGRLRRAQEGLQGDEGGFEGEDGRPGVLEDVKADRAGCGRDVRMVDFGEKFHLHGREGVLLGDDDVLRPEGILGEQE